MATYKEMLDWMISRAAHRCSSCVVPEFKCDGHGLANCKELIKQEVKERGRA